jgi:hypothetical protein
VLDGQDDRLRPVGSLQLGDDGADVPLDRGNAHYQALGDLDNWTSPLLPGPEPPVLKLAVLPWPGGEVALSRDKICVTILFAWRKARFLGLVSKRRTEGLAR